MSRALKIGFVLLAYAAILAAPFVFLKSLNVDPTWARRIVSIGRVFSADLTLVRLQDLMGSAATLVPFYLASFQRGQPIYLYVFGAAGALGYFVYLLVQLKLDEEGVRLSIQNIFDGEAQSAAEQIRATIDLVKLAFFWMVVAAIAAKFKWTDKLLGQVQR